MKTSKVLSLLCMMVLLQTADAQEYDIYFPNNETNLLQFQKEHEILAALVSDIQGTANLQLGYSPLKHLSIDGAYLFRATNLSTTNTNRKKQAFSFALGTYWALEKKSNTANSNNDDGIQIGLKVGYSFNNFRTDVETSLNTFPVQTRSALTEVDFNKAFVNFNLAYRHNWGMVSFNTSYQNIQYNRVAFNGQGYEDLSKLNDITTQLREDNTYHFLSIGIHTMFDAFNTRAMQVSFGGSFPILYFQNFRNQSAELDNRYIYAGFCFNINRFFNRSK